MSINLRFPIESTRDISVIIPAYNAAPYLRQSIDSVIAQEGDGVEIIVVDDGSTDGTPEILAGYGDRILSTRQHNQGLSAARNRGIEMASGNWLAFLDADDLWLPGYAQTMVTHAGKADRSIAAIACGWRHVDIGGCTLGAAVSRHKERVSFEQLVLGNQFPPVAICARRSVVMRLGGFDMQIFGVQDWDLWLQMTLHGHQIECVPDVLVAYRHVPGSMSRDVVRMRDNGVKVLDKIFNSPQLKPCHLSLRELAYGLVRVWAGANFFGVGLNKDGFAEFVEAFVSFPALLDDARAFDAILCAEQPLAWKGTGQRLNLVEAKDRLDQVISMVFRQQPRLAHIYRSRTQQLSHRALGRLAYAQGDLQLAQKCAWQSLIQRPSRLGVKEVLRYAVKTLATRN